jgi:hypothetical protein
MTYLVDDEGDRFNMKGLNISVPLDRDQASVFKLEFDVNRDIARPATVRIGVAGAAACQPSGRLPDAQRFYLKLTPQNRVELAARLIQGAFRLTIEARACRSDRLAKPHVTRIGVLS